MICPNCKANIDDNARFCVYCGFSLENVIHETNVEGIKCGNCNATNSEGSLFCESCGAKLDDKISCDILIRSPIDDPELKKEFASSVSRPLDRNEELSEIRPSHTTNIVDDTETDVPVSVGIWLVILLVLMIPGINLIMLLVLAFWPGSNTILKNFSRAALIFTFFLLMLVVILFIIYPDL